MDRRAFLRTGAGAAATAGCMATVAGAAEEATKKTDANLRTIIAINPGWFKGTHVEQIEQVAAKLSERFGLKSSWTADVLNFSGSGVDGAIELQPGAVRVTAKLGFLLSAMKGMVEGEIQRVLKEKLG